MLFLFIYKEVGSLTYEQTCRAVVEPVKKFNVEYTNEAIQRIYEITKGYPFFIQQMCQVVYKNMDEHLIDVADVDNNIDEFYRLLDVGFFKVRYERCAESDKKFVFAMVKCGELPCTISNQI